MRRLAPGVDVATFRPGAGGAGIRARLGLAGRPVVVCVSRLVPRKGQDTLLRAWPAVLSAVPDAALLVVGSGPFREKLENMAERLPPGAVHFTGPVAGTDLPAYYDAGDVFAMPCRTRRGGLDVEGLGIVYLEASATGLPVVGGDSGGAPDAIRDGQTGYVVPGRSPGAVAERVTELLTDPARAKAMGQQGLDWVHQEWRWDLVTARLQDILAG
jgi:phosphatidylinositol alpha-1,6-mannosyltransferase